jgi:hypothetical protein
MINDSNISGEYIVRIDGKEVARKKNALTQFGKISAMRSIIGQTVSFANSIGIGTSTASNTFNGKLITNTRLGYEIKKFNIYGAFVDMSEDYSKLIFRTVINDNERYKIRELGLFSATVQGGQTSISDSTVTSFESTDTFQNNAGISIGNAADASPNASAYFISSTTNTSIMIGDEGVFLPKGASLSYIPPTSIKVNTLSDTDTFTLSYIKTTNTPASVTVTLYDADSNFRSYDFNNSVATASCFVSQNISSFSASSGNITWSDIRKVLFVEKNGPSIILDGFRFDATPDTVNIENSLLSRVVLTNEIVANKGEELEIEYNLSMGFNEGLA